MHSRVGRPLLAAVAVVVTVAAWTAWWLSDKNQEAQAKVCSLVAYSSGAYVIPTAPIQDGWPNASTYEARISDEWSPLRGYGGKNRKQIVGVSAPDEATMPISVRVLDAERRTLWTGQLTAKAEPSEPNGRGCGTYFQAAASLDVAAKELRQRSVPKGFRF